MHRKVPISDHLGKLIHDHTITCIMHALLMYTFYMYMYVVDPACT